MSKSKKTENPESPALAETQEAPATALAPVTFQPPATTQLTAREMGFALVDPILDLIPHLPFELGNLLTKKFVNPKLNPQPQLPGMQEQTGLGVTWLKQIGEKTANKVFDGRTLINGTVLGKTVLFSPKEEREEIRDGKKVTVTLQEETPSFPFILLGGWEERILGKYDVRTKVMHTRCASRDGINASMINGWGATTCKPCPHDTKNRPKYNDDKVPGDRCKKKMTLIGVGGDWEDIYVFQIAGMAIVDFYSKKLAKHASDAANMGLPWHAVTFMLRTEEGDDGYWNMVLDNVLKTAQKPRYNFAESNLFWKGQTPEQAALTYQVLDYLRTMCQRYIQERHKAALDAVAKQRTSGEKVTPPQADDSDIPDSDTAGLD